MVKKFLIYVFMLSCLGLFAQRGCLKADIILVADLSGSIQGNEQFIAHAYEVFVDRFDLWEHGIRIGAFTFSKDVHLVSHLTENKGELLDAIDVIRRNPYGTTTNLTGAMSAVYNEYIDNWRDEARRILILISDGHADERTTFLASIRVLKEKLGVEVCGIYVHTYDGIPKDMEFISESYCYVVSNYEELALILERLNICG